MSPASYRAAPPRVAPANLPAVQRPGKSVVSWPRSAGRRSAAAGAGGRRAGGTGRRARAGGRRRGAGALRLDGAVDGILQLLLSLAIGGEVTGGKCRLGILDRLL